MTGKRLSRPGVILGFHELRLVREERQVVHLASPKGQASTSR